MYGAPLGAFSRPGYLRGGPPGTPFSPAASVSDEEELKGLCGEAVYVINCLFIVRYDVIWANA